MDDMNVLGIMTCFTYDEFYPDHIYDNTRYATDDCIKRILEKDRVTFLLWFQKENIRLNNYFPITEEKFKEIINRFKESFEDIQLNDLNNIDCVIDDTDCQVKGNYYATLVLPLEEVIVKENWLVEFNWNDDYWEIYNIQIEGINF